MAQTTTSKQVSGKTGETCQESGPYQSERNAKVTVFVAKGDPFPPDTDGASTTWTRVGS
ncbi:MAG: hypothetical protein ACRD26_09405 [Vicinamibacterales bacterium]